MRRSLLILSVAALVVAMVVIASPAFAADDSCQVTTATFRCGHDYNGDGTTDESEREGSYSEEEAWDYMDKYGGGV